ncbi:extracellular solute-binding protein [Candidatus Bathyarchaeota archaeon]|nr:extracellular solute-binding protein [Candidatus Bathyarchaeota archaeon]
MDKRMIMGAALVVVIGLGFALYMMNPPQPPVENGENGNGEPPEKGTATVTGTVTDDDGEPVSGATVTIDGTSVTTGSGGTFTVTVEEGSYTITVSKDGYESDSEEVQLSKDQEYSGDYSLVVIETGGGDVIMKIITRHGSDILFKARDAFWETGIAQQYGMAEKKDIRFLGVSSGLWVETIRRSDDVDVAWGGGPVVFDVVNNEGLLAPLTSDEVMEILENIPDEVSGSPTKRYSGDEVRWVGSAISSFGFTINTEFLSTEGLPEPKTWKELANETYAVTLPSITSIGTADATLSTSNTRMFEIILQTYGWDEGWKILTNMGANARIFDRSESVRDAAIQGTIGAGTTIDFYGYTAQLQNPELCSYVLPQDGTAVNADPIALVSTSKHPDLAQAFIAWVLSPAGQEIWLDENINRMPVNPAVFDTPAGLARSDLKDSYEATKNAITIEFSDDLALSYETSMMFFYKSTIVEAQEPLISLWLELTEAEDTGDITHQEFLALVDDMSNPSEFTFTDPESSETVTFTEAYAQSVNDRLLTDATYKEQMRSVWLEAARARYSEVMDQLDALVG